MNNWVEVIGKQSPVTYETPTKQGWTVTALERFAPLTTLQMLSKAILRLQAGRAANDPQAFTSLVIDADGEVVREIRGHIAGRGVSVYPCPVTGNLRHDLLVRLGSLLSANSLRISESLALVDELRQQLLKVDETLWRQNDSDDLVSAVALAMWRAKQSPCGWMGGSGFALQALIPPQGLR